MTVRTTYTLALLGIAAFLAGCGGESSSPEDDASDDAADDDEAFMTASFDGQDLEISRVQCRSGGANFGVSGIGDDLSVDFTFFALEGSNDADPEALHRVSVFFGDRNAAVADGEQYEIRNALDELQGFTTGDEVPAAEGSVELEANDSTQAEGSGTLEFAFSC